MWTCRKCKAVWEFSQVIPAIDNDGFYFLCPVCDHRNTLVDVGEPGSAALTQPDIEWPSCKPYED